jgi:hypothetical protein
VRCRTLRSHRGRAGCQIGLLVRAGPEPPVPSGQLLFNAQLPAGVNTYRAYREPWIGDSGWQQ